MQKMKKKSFATSSSMMMLAVFVYCPRKVCLLQGKDVHPEGITKSLDKAQHVVVQKHEDTHRGRKWVSKVERKHSLKKVTGT